MNFNKINKFFIALFFAVIVSTEIDTRRPGLYGENSEETSREERRMHRRGHRGRHHGVRRKGTICGKAGCRKAKVIGEVSPTDRHNAVVCKGNVCRRAVVRRHRDKDGQDRDMRRRDRRETMMKQTEQNAKPTVKV